MTSTTLGEPANGRLTPRYSLTNEEIYKRASIVTACSDSRTVSKPKRS
jgi:hypothetical protein